MYTNNLMKVFFKTLFDSNFPFFLKLKTSFYFYEIIKVSFSQENLEWKKKSTRKNHNHQQ
jgi:hypothetical protein